MATNIEELQSLVEKSKTKATKLETQMETLIEYVADALGCKAEDVTPEFLAKSIKDLQKKEQELSKALKSKESDVEKATTRLKNLLEVE